MAEVQKKSYKVESPLVHDGKSYNPGDEVELTESEAASLAGVVSGDPVLPLYNAPAVTNPAGFPAPEEAITDATVVSEPPAHKKGK
jgi:hypothetical protein